MNERMRILVVVNGGIGARVTGPEIRGWAMARALAERHDVTVAIHDPPARLAATGLASSRSRAASLIREARRHDAVVAPVIPPYLFAALRGSRTIMVSDQYDPIWLELSIFTEQPGISRVIRAQKHDPRRAAALRRHRRLRRRRQRELLRSRPGRRSDARPAAHRRNVPFGSRAVPPAAAEAARCGRAFPQIGANDPVVLWWGKVWKWFDADDRAARVRARRAEAPGRAPGDQRRQGAEGEVRSVRAHRSGARAGRRARPARPQRLLPRRVDAVRPPPRVPAGRRPRPDAPRRTRPRRRSPPARATWTTCGPRCRACSRTATRWRSASAPRASRSVVAPVDPDAAAGGDPAPDRAAGRARSGPGRRPRARRRPPLERARGASRGADGGRHGLAPAALWRPARPDRQQVLRPAHVRPRIWSRASGRSWVSFLPTRGNHPSISPSAWS